MAKQSSKSKLANIGGAVKEHVGEDIRYGGGGGLPSGIKGGVARLTQCYFGTYEKGDLKGEMFFRAAGTVLKPESFEGQRVQGRTTSVGPIPVCDVTRRNGKTITLSENVAEIMNELKKLGWDDSELADLSEEEAGQAVEDAAQALQEAAPYFGFDTWGGGKWTGDDGVERDGRVNETWLGTIADFEEALNDGVDEEKSPAKGKTSPPKSNAPSKPAKPKQEEKEEEEGDEMPDAKTLKKLGKDADGGDESAAERLTEIGLKVGLSQKQIKGADDWAAVAELIAEASEGGEEEEKKGKDDDEGGEAEGPNQGDTVNYKPPGAKKAFECEVTAVFAGKQTANVRNLASGDLYKQVAWDKLEF